MGRRKIEITMVKDTNTRQVTFSKRRTGLFKKANELSILCGAEVAIVVFSPGNKPYSFGHPGVDAVAAKFLQQEPKSNEAQNGPSSEIVDMDKFNQQLAEVMEQLRLDEKKGAAHNEAINQHIGTQLSELQELHASHMELRSRVKSRLNDFEAAETMILLAQAPVEGVKIVLPKRKEEKIDAM